jgi:hypothetical protein
VVWGQSTISIPAASIVWHSYSTDGGETWSEPQKVIELSQQGDFYYNALFDMDIAVDSYGRLYWVGKSAMSYPRDKIVQTTNYRVWNPVTQTWGTNKRLDLGKYLQVELEYDQSNDRLYLFYGAYRENEDIPGSLNYVYTVAQPPEPLPTIDQSGPLRMHRNYPNPFNPTTMITYTLEETGKVDLTIYDINGRVVLQRAMGEQSPGQHHYRLDMSSYSSGIYFYQISVNNSYQVMNKMVYVK